jgi:hypothetical protein
MECVTMLLEQAQAAGLEVHADGDRLVVRGPQSAEALARQLLAHKGDLMRLLAAPPPDVIASEPCDVCGSRERWQWLDGRELCRPCVVLDVVPMTLASTIRERTLSSPSTPWYPSAVWVHVASSRSAACAPCPMGKRRDAPRVWDRRGGGIAQDSRVP